MTWKESLKEYSQYLLLERNFSKNSHDAYFSDISKFSNFCLKKLKKDNPKDILYEDLQEYIYQLSGSKLAERSQARNISSLKSFFRFLLEENEISLNPAHLLETPKQGLYLPDTLGIQEINQLIGAIDRSSLLGERNYTMLEVLYGCGLRVSELINLLISDLFLDEEFIRVLGKGEKQRLVPIPEATSRLLKRYLETIRPHFRIEKGHTDFLFLNQRGKALTRVMVFLIIQNLAKQIGLKKKISPHTFRHSFATHLLQNGADLRFIQEILGHSSITTTEIYTHLENEELREVVLQYHPRNL